MSLTFVLAGLLAATLFAGVLVRALTRKAAADAAVDGRQVLEAGLAAADELRAAGDSIAASEVEIEAKRAALSTPAASQPASGRALKMVAVLVALALPFSVIPIYLSVGAPDWRARLAEAPAATPTEMSADDRRAMIENMVDGLAARLAETPGDADSWRMLARSQAVLGRFDASKASYRQLLGQVEGDIDDWRNFAGVFISAAPEGAFPTDGEFLSALDEIVARNPGDPFALFYQAGAARELGDPAAAAATWRLLLSRLPADAPVRDALEALAVEAEALSAASRPEME